MGFFSDEEKTFTNLTFNDIFPKDYAVNAAKQAVFFTMDGMADFNSKFFSFKKSYRPRIKDSWMIKRGFKPNTPIKVDTIQKDLLLAEIQNTYDSDAHHISYFRISNGWIRDQAAFWLEKNGYNWSSKRNELIIVTQDEDGNDVETKYTRMDVKYKGENPDPNIPDNIDTIEATFTVVDDDTVPAYIIDIPNEFKEDTMYVEYYRNTNESDPLEVREEFYHFIIQRQGYDRLFISKDLVVTPIVPLKEEGTFRICSGPGGKATNSGSTNTGDSTGGLISNIFSGGIQNQSCANLKPGNNKYSDLLEASGIQESSAAYDACKKGQECGKTAVSEYLDKYGIDPIDIIESLEETDDDGEPIVDNAYIMTGLKVIDPYDITPGTYDSSEVQNLPPKFMKKAIPSPDGSKQTLTPEACEWWKRKNKRFRHSYARILYKTLSEYGSGTVNISLAGAQMMFTIDFDEELHEGILPEAVQEITSYGNTPTRSVVNTRYALIYEDTEKKNQAKQDFHDRLDNADGFFGTSLELKYGGPRYLKSIKMQVDANHYKIINIYELREEVRISGQWFLLFGDGRWTSDSDKDDENKGVGKKYPRLLVPNDLHNHVNFTEYVLMKEYGMHFMLYSEKTIVIKWWKKFIGLVIGLIICFASYGTACGWVQVIINWVIAYAVSYVLELILAEIDSPILKGIIRFVVGIVTALATGQLDLTQFTSEAFLSLASSATSIAVNTAQEIAMLEAKEQQELEMEQDAGDAISEGISEYENLDILPPEVILATDKSVHYSFLETHGPKALFDQQEMMFNYDALYDVSGAIDLRVQVRSG